MEGCFLNIKNEKEKFLLIRVIILTIYHTTVIEDI
jgi:hypothetical protein